MLRDAPDMLYYYIYHYINVMENIEKDRKGLAGFKTIETKYSMGIMIPSNIWNH